MKSIHKKNKSRYYYFFITLFVTSYFCFSYANLVSSSILKKLYFTKHGSIVKKLVTKPWFSKIAGWYCDTALSRMHINSFVKKYNINCDEASKSLDKYCCFNEFFTRKLKPNTRPIDQNLKSIISPVDGLLYIKSSINKKTRFFVKGKLFNLKLFLQDKSLGNYFKNGTLMIFYLSPADYHRFHFPFNTKATEAKQIEGNYESVNPLIYQSDTQPLLENERHLILLKTQNKQVAFIPVGALCVGKISETYIPEKNYNKGDEAGYFSFGGSTVVLLFPENMITPDSTLPLEQFTPIKMGMKIGMF